MKKKLPIRKHTNSMERRGVNFVRDVVESANSTFQEIHRENDYGNDAYVELVEGDQVTGVSIAVQIKSGPSYCTQTTCRIPAKEAQWNYWRNSRLPVLGVVFDPNEKCAYWVDLGRFVRAHSYTKSLCYEKNELSRFDGSTFTTIIIPLVLDRHINLPLEQSLRFADADSMDMHSIGVRSLFHAHGSSLKTWLAFEKLLRHRPVSSLEPSLPYLLAHIPGHGDIFWHSGTAIPDAVRRQVKERMGTWGRDEVLQLLRFMDENGVARGTLGQSVFAVLDLCVPKVGSILHDVLDDDSIDFLVRQNAMLLLCLMEQGDIEPTLRVHLHTEGIQDTARIMLEHLRKQGFFA